MKVNNTIRLRTEPGLSKNIYLKVDQEFDTIDFLSLKITQSDAYRNFCSDYGVVAGRVIANEGFGVSNAKVCVFIPLSSEDSENQAISSQYPYSTPTDTDTEGVRFNLLPKIGRNFTLSVRIPNDSSGNSVTPGEYSSSNNSTSLGTFEAGSTWEVSDTSFNYTTYARNVIGNGPQVPVGTFPSKFQTLDSDLLVEIYDKYYKFSTKTNSSGDYMIFGVPTGTKTVHMDVDLSDAGSATLTPDDFVELGFPPSSFDLTNNKFKASTNLDTLPQIEAQNLSVDVVPFWGNTEQCEIGITRLDFKLTKTIIPSALLVFQAFTNTSNLYISNGCGSIVGPGNDDDYTSIGNMQPLGVTVGGTTNLDDGPTLTEKSFPNGNVIYSIPMYNDRYVTNEVGDLVPSTDDDVGIPTSGAYKIMVWATQGNQQGGEGNGTALHLINKTIPYHYDLKNGKQQIYTPGMVNRAKNGNIGDTNRLRIRSSSSSNLSYPSTGKASSGQKSFGAFDLNDGNAGFSWAPVYGSLYFPRFQYKESGNPTYCKKTATDSGGYSDYGQSAFVYVDNQLNTTVTTTAYWAVTPINITDLLQIFLPFGGNLNVTSANNGLYGNNQDTDVFGGNAGTNANNPAGIEMANQSYAFGVEGFAQTTAGTAIDWTFNDPTKLNKFISAQPNNFENKYFVRINKFTGSGSASDERIDPGRYFIYFGLTENNNVLKSLKDFL